MVKSRAILVLGAASLAGCASLVSAPVKTEADRGLVYFLPKRDFVVTLTVASDASTRAVNVERTAAYPDGGQRFLLRYGRNLVGKNVLDVGVTPSGLLKSAKSTTTSNLADALKELAGLTGAKSITAAAEDQGDCSTPGVYSWVVTPTSDASTTLRPCNLQVRIKRVFSEASIGSVEIVDGLADDSTTKAKQQKIGAYRAGLYYRNEIPYQVEVTSTDSPVVQRTFLVFSPSESALRYLPIERTLFSDNEATLTFEDGVPTAYTQSADGELIGLLKLPAAVLGAYFDAIGNAFTKRKENLTSETEYLSAAAKLELCKTAVATKDPELISKACE